MKKCWSVCLLEEEVIGDELFFLCLGKGAEGVKGSSKVSWESLASFDNLVHDFDSLFVADAWTKRVSFEVTANSDAG